MGVPFALGEQTVLVVVSVTVVVELLFWESIGAGGVKIGDGMLPRDCIKSEKERGLSTGMVGGASLGSIIAASWSYLPVTGEFGALTLLDAARGEGGERARGGATK